MLTRVGIIGCYNNKRCSCLKKLNNLPCDAYAINVITVHAIFIVLYLVNLMYHNILNYRPTYELYCTWVSDGIGR